MKRKDALEGGERVERSELDQTSDDERGGCMVVFALLLVVVVGCPSERSELYHQNLAAAISAASEDRQRPRGVGDKRGSPCSVVTSEWYQ